MGSKINIYEQGQIEILFGSHDHSFPLHSHECWCIGMVTEGEVWFKIKDQECLLKKGMMYVIPSNAGVLITKKRGYHFVTICFKDELRERFQTIELEQYFLKLKDTDNFMRVCYDFMWYGDMSKIIQEFLEIMRPMISIKNIKEQKQLSLSVKKAAEFIKKNQNNRFDLDNIAMEANISKYHLVRLFKKEMGVTPNQYYIQNKLRTVKTKIMEEQSEVQIATELNYADQSHLCRQFKQLMGVSLQEYKRNVRRK